MRPKEAKNKSGLNSPILKSYYKYHIWGSLKSKTNSKISSGRGCRDKKIQHFCYCGLNIFQTDFSFWPLLRPNWGLAKIILLWIYQMGFEQCLYFSFGVSKSLLNEKSAFPRHFTFQFRTLYSYHKYLFQFKWQMFQINLILSEGDNLKMILSHILKRRK